MKASKLKNETGGFFWSMWEVKVEGRHFILDGQNGHWDISETVTGDWVDAGLLGRADTKREAMEWIEENIVDGEA